MLGKKIYKPVVTQEQLTDYSATAKWCNANNSVIVDQGEYFEVVEVPAPTGEELNAIKIEQLKAELSSTDYKTLKYIDGALTEEEYAEVKKHRADLRKQINELEK